MAKIICPNKEFTGIAASVAFVKGVGSTEDEYLIKWFKDNGYEIEEEPSTKKK